MAGLTLDAGALIAAEKNDRRFWGFLRVAAQRGVVPTVPAAALAQVWRGARSARLAQLLSSCDVEPLDEPLAKRTGILLGRTATADVADASIVAGAASRGDRILTTDPEDLVPLAQAARGAQVIDLRRVSLSRSRPRRRR